MKSKALYGIIFLAFVLLKASAQLQPELVVQKGNDDSINCINYSPDGRNFLTVCAAESTVKIWEAASGRLLKTIAAAAKGASYSDNGLRILLEETNQFAVYDALTDSLLFYVNRGAEKFPAVSFANEGAWLVAAGIDAVVEIKRAADNIPIQTIPTKHGKVLSAQLSPDNKHLITFSEDSTVSMMNITTDSTLYEFHFPGFMVQNFAFSKTGKYAVIKMISPYYYEVEKNVLVEVATGKQINYEGTLFDISPDEKFLLAGSDGGLSVYERSILTDSVLFETQFTKYTTEVFHGSYSKDGNSFSIWNQYFVSVYDSRSFGRTATYRGDSVEHFATARDGALNPDNPPITSVSFNPDSKKILFGSATGRIKEMNTSQQLNSIHEIENPFNAIVDAQYIPAQQSIFTKAADNLGIVWNIEDATIQSAKDLTYFCDLGFDDSVGVTQSQYRRTATFNKTGDFFITKSEVGSTVWRTKNFEKILSTTGYENDVNTNHFSISADGNFICSIEEDYNKIFEGINIFLTNKKGGSSKKIDSITTGFFKISNDWIPTPSDISFKGDSHHVIISSQEQILKAPFLLKTIQFKDSISVLGISPYQYTIKGSNGFDSTVDVSLDYAYSTKLHCYIICTNDTIYRISVTGKVIKKNAIDLKQPQLFYPLEFDPETKYIFIQDADEKIHAVSIETGQPVYSLKSEDSYFTSVSFSADNKRFIVLNEDRTRVSVFDATTGNALFSFKGHTPQLFNAVFSPDGKFILCCAQDGSYEKRDGATGKLIYSFFLFKDRDYAIVLPEGYYYSSSRSDVKFLNFRLNNKLYNFAQFDLQFNRPDKILQALGSSDTALINAYREAWLKRVSKSGFTEADFINNTIHVPDVSLEHKETLPAVILEDTISLSFRLQDSLYKVTAYTIYINDVPVNGMNGTRLQQPSNNSNVKQTILLGNGINKIEINCINEKGAESRKETFYIACQPAAPQPSKTWFIGIGINHYSQHGYLPNLSYCVKDITDLSAAFGKKFTNIYIDTLFNDDATRQNILALKKLLMQTGIEDRVIISFSGHGLTFNDVFYFATPATNPGNPGQDAVSYSDLENLLDSIPARKKLLLIDACHSGEADKDEINGGIITTGMTYARASENERGAAKNNNSSVEIIDVKSDTVASRAATFNIFGIMKNTFVDLRKNNGAFVIAASQSNQQAQENRQLANGVFTNCLLQQLHQYNTLKVSALLQKINECVAGTTTGQQPASRQELPESDWDLW